MYRFILMLLAFGLVRAHRGRHDAHKHYIPDKDKEQNVFRDKSFLQDYEHIKEDLQDMYNSDFSDRLDAIEMESYYFQIHDLDANGKLDGLEMLAAINHVTDRDEEVPQQFDTDPTLAHQQWWNDKFDEDAVLIDRVLQEEDLDRDGYLSYLEYALGRQKEAGQI